MSEELKYCKFCDKEKPIKEFCKSGGFIKNICRECQNTKQKQIYQNSKKVKELQNQLQQKENIIKEVREDLDKKITFCTNEADGTTNDKICRITIQYLKHLKEILDKEVN